MVELPTPDDYAEATGLFVYGSDVYISGYTSNTATSKSRAMYWKNGVPVFLTDANSNEFANSIFVRGGDVYVVGQELVGSNYVVKYWKNGVATTLTENSSKGFGLKVFVSNGDVYVGGIEFNATTSQYVVKYWKNGAATNLTPDDKSGSVNSIFVSGNDVYVAGREDNPRKGVYWKNGVRKELSTNGWVSGIYVDDNIVYAAVTDVISVSAYQARYLKDSQETILGDNLTHTEVWDLTVFEGTVYTVGTKYNGTVNLSKIWIDGVQEDLPITGDYSYAVSVFVTRH
jgi:hypothetical protein